MEPMWNSTSACRELQLSVCDVSTCGCPVVKACQLPDGYQMFITCASYVLLLHVTWVSIVCITTLGTDIL